MKLTCARAPRPSLGLQCKGGFGLGDPEDAFGAIAVIEQAQQLQRKEERERRLAAGREDDGLGGLSDAEARS